MKIRILRNQGFMYRRTHGAESLKKRVCLADVHDLATAGLRIAYEALDADGVQGWLTWGSVLGLHREGRFLPHDNDVDIAVPVDAITPTIIERMARSELHLFRETGFRGKVFNRKFLYRGCAIDFYGMEDIGDRYISKSRYGKSCLIYSHPKLPLARRMFEGTEVWVPRDCEAYVRHIFGEGWIRKPPPGWHNSFSLPNLIGIEGPPVAMFDLARRIAKWKVGNGLSRMGLISLSRGA
jgi:hypothetical protein